MADEASNKPAKTEPSSTRLKLIPSNHSDAPVLANTSMVVPAAGFVYLDFGFVEPGVVPALEQLARNGSKLPEQIEGRLAARVALSLDVVQQLYQQLGSVLQRLQQAQAPKKPDTDSAKKN